MAIGEKIRNIIAALEYEANLALSDGSQSTLEFNANESRISMSADTDIDAALFVTDRTGKHENKKYWNDIAVPILLSDGKHDNYCDVSQSWSYCYSLILIFGVGY